MLRFLKNLTTGESGDALVTTVGGKKMAYFMKPDGTPNYKGVPAENCKYDEVKLTKQK